MAKYHVNRETGRAGQCRATKKGCPLGADTPHFETKEEANTFIEKEAQAGGEAFSKLSKKASNSSNENPEVAKANNKLSRDMKKLEKRAVQEKEMDNIYGDAFYEARQKVEKVFNEFDNAGRSPEALAKLNSELADMAAANENSADIAFKNNDADEAEYQDGVRDVLNEMTDAVETYNASIYWAKKHEVKATAETSKNSSSATEGNNNLERLREDLKNNYQKVEHRGATSLNKAEVTDLQRISNNEKVPAERMDKLIDKLRFADLNDSYAREGQVEAGKKVLETLKAVRSTDATPNTLVTGKNFDPSKETVFDFSKNKYDDDARYAIKKMKRAVTEIDDMKTFQKKHEDYANQEGITSEEKERELNTAKRFESRVNRAKALSNAQVKEFKYKYDNDPSFSRFMTQEEKAYVKTIRSDNSNTDEVIEGVKKLK